MIINTSELHPALWEEENLPAPWQVLFQVHRTGLPETILAEQVFSLSQYDIERLSLNNETVHAWDLLASSCRELPEAKQLSADDTVLSMLGSALRYYIDTMPEALQRVHIPTEINKIESSRRRLRTHIAQEMLDVISNTGISSPSLWQPDNNPRLTGMYL